jgi:hypothetical protein
MNLEPRNSTKTPPATHSSSLRLPAPTQYMSRGLYPLLYDVTAYAEVFTASLPSNRRPIFFREFASTGACCLAMVVHVQIGHITERITRK